MLREPTLQEIILGLHKENVAALMRTALRMLDIQKNNRYAEIILKFQDGRVCRGGGVMVKD